MANNQSLVFSTLFDKELPDFGFNISFVCVFGENANEIIIVTNEDNVFAFGDNKDGCLGLGHKNTVKEPTKVIELCNKNVIHICYGNGFVMALMKSGQCFLWGRYKRGMIGNVTQIDCNEPKHINDLANEVIIAISCGEIHALVLTQKGIVYDICYNFVKQLTAIKVGGLNFEKIISISCGFNHSLVLTEEGAVYSWGPNTYGQLGVAKTFQSSPMERIFKERVTIKQITCGQNYSLLLSLEGDIYAFGYNEKGSLGNGNKINQNIPIKLNNEIKFKEIGSHSLSNISIALSQNGFCYVWGDCNGEVITTPKETQNQTIADCFVICSKVKKTLNLMRFHSKIPKNKITERIAKLFNNPEKSDLKIKVKNEFIYVHKTILIYLCKHFESMFSKNWSESESNEIQITQYSYSTYYSFLKYIYTDSIDVKVEEAIDLYDLANCYLEEELKEKCIEAIESGISIENFCTVYSFAVEYGLQELENFCLKFDSNKRKRSTKQNSSNK